jgi:hypothetical protein
VSEVESDNGSEVGRQIAEADREDAELDRKGAARKQAASEAAREQGEAGRVIAEEERRTTEDVRTVAEMFRELGERMRLNAEELRVNNEAVQILRGEMHSMFRAIRDAAAVQPASDEIAVLLRKIDATVSRRDPAEGSTPGRTPLRIVRRSPNE